jgi:hypothetical protein
MALKFAVERTYYSFQITVINSYFKLLYVDKLETCLRISLVVFFSKKTETKIVNLRLIWSTSEFKYQNSNAQWIV